MPSIDRLAFSATVHCLTGCAIGEVLGLVIATQLGWHDAAAIALAIVLAFVFGYAFTLVPLLSSGVAVRAALGLALAADTLSITVMEIVDNAILLDPGGDGCRHHRRPVLGQPGDRTGRGRSGRVPGQSLADRAWPRACGDPRTPLSRIAAADLHADDVQPGVRSGNPGRPVKYSSTAVHA